MACGSTKYYRIRAGSACGTSAFSATLTGYTAPCSTAVDRCDQVTQFISSDHTEIGDTTGAANDYTPKAFACTQEFNGTGVGLDVVYGVKTASQCDVYIYTNYATCYVLRDACDNAGTCVPTDFWFGGDARKLGFRTEANVPYYVIVDYDVANYGHGYTIEVKVSACDLAVPSCPAGTEWSQTPAPYGTKDSTSLQTTATGPADIFNTPDPIQHVRWWGFYYTEGCNPTIDTQFDLELYNAGFGTPQGLNSVYAMDVTPVDTGHTVRGQKLYQYDFDFATPLPLNVGWLRIKPTTLQSCAWFWTTSDQGNRFALKDISPLTFADLNMAFCLSSAPSRHTADQTGDNIISLSELLRIIQFYNSGGVHCQAGTEDGFAPAAGDTTCAPRDSDYNPQDWVISLSELLRVIQFYNSGAYHPCPGQGSEDGFCPGA